MFQVKKLSKSEFLDMLANENECDPYRIDWFDMLKEFDESDEEYCEIIPDEYTSPAEIAETASERSGEYGFDHIEVTMVGSRVVLYKQ